MTVSAITSAGAVPSRRGTVFTVWAPYARSMAVELPPGGRKVPMKSSGGGQWTVFVPGVKPGALYKFLVNGEARPDPASALQPQGVHGPSAVVDHSAFNWSDAGWKGLPVEKLIIYELHPGTFTPRGDFAGIEEKLPYLKELGITALELMPVAQFPGGRNWGYDGVYPYAAQSSYGGPEGLKRLVNACHKAGLAIILDVVYNHLGPEGNYLECYGPYFTDRYQTPWGKALNYDGPDSGGVRDFFIGNALYWFRDFHFDGLRLDAVHGIFDFSAKHLLAEMQERVAALAAETGRKMHLIAESDLNDPRLVSSAAAGGYGLAAQWSDDFHHALHTLLTGESQGYYEDFGGLPCLAKAFTEAFVYDGAYSKHRRRAHGAPAAGLPASSFVVCSQNHDQVGNRLSGDRLAALAGEKKLRLAAGAVLLSPYVPLLFMGEEYAEDNPFQYFVSHGDPALIAAVREGRKREFAAFGWKAEPPDPQSESVFSASRLDWAKAGRGRHAGMLSFYKQLISLRRRSPSLASCAVKDMEIKFSPSSGTISLLRRRSRSETFTVFNFTGKGARLALPPGSWKEIFSSEAELKPRVAAKTALLAPESFIVFTRSYR